MCAADCRRGEKKKHIFKAFMQLIEVYQCFQFPVYLSMELNLEPKLGERWFFHLG